MNIEEMDKLHRVITPKLKAVMEKTWDNTSKLMLMDKLDRAITPTLQSVYAEFAAVQKKKNLESTK